MYNAITQRKPIDNTNNRQPCTCIPNTARYQYIKCTPQKIQPKVHKAINIQKVNQFKTQYTAVTGKCKSIHNTNNAQECIPIHNSVNTHVKKKLST